MHGWVQRNLRSPKEDSSMPKQWGDLSKEEKEQFEDLDIAGEEGGDTGNSAYIDDGEQAEKGDARRDKPVLSEKAKNKDKDS
jgi:hypothetical protein